MHSSRGEHDSTLAAKKPVLAARAEELRLLLEALRGTDPLELVELLGTICHEDEELRRRLQAVLWMLLETDESYVSEHPDQTSGETAIVDPTTRTTRATSQVLVSVEGDAQTDELPRAHTAGSVPITQDIQVGVEVGPYRLLKLVGEGGMGMVYLAQQYSPIIRQVALKLIKPGMDSRQIVARFEAERQVLAVMDHPHIARVYDAGQTQYGRPFFVMEYVEGKSITQFCDDEALGIRDRLTLFIRVCNAIGHAHQKAILHRDVKPSNVLVIRVDGEPTPKVIDFGVAKALGAALSEGTLLTQTGVIVGTLQYMSPEQAELGGVDVDTRSDIYALGVLLHELLTGQPPIDRKSLLDSSTAEILHRIRENEPEKPSSRLSRLNADLALISRRRASDPSRLIRAIQGDLDWIVMKSLRIDRSMRYETAGELGRDIQRHLDGEAVEAGPPSRIQRARRFARKNRGPLALGLVVGMALAAGVIGLFEGYRQARLAESYALAKLGMTYMELGKWTDAEVALRECLEIRRKSFPRSWLHANASSMLGESLVSQGRYQEAEPLLLDGYARLLRLRASLPPDARQNLGLAEKRVEELYDAWEKPERKSEWIRSREAAPK